jgi:uncharacterized protein YbcI
MASPNHPLHGDAFLAAVTESLVGLHERHYGRRPAAARSQLMGDDLLACVMGGVYTEVEKTLIEIQREPMVHEARSAFQKAMQGRLVAAVERLSGRPVEGFFSTHHVGPDLEVEIFVLGAGQPGAAP